jgi:signal transduction histidine kinase
MTGDSDEYALVHLSSDGHVLFSDATAEDLGLPASEPARKAAREGETVVMSTDGPEGRVRVASVPVDGPGVRESVVQFGRLVQADLEAINRLLLVLVPMGLGALVLAGVGGLFMSRRALRPAREAFEKQRAFIADASHELKTPLSLVRINAEVLLRDPTASDVREILKHQLSEVDRMGAVLSDLLLLSRLDAGKLAVWSEPFDLVALLVEATDRFRARAADAGVIVEVSVPGKLPVHGDAERTGRILAALLDNAVRFTPVGGRVVAAAKRLRDGGAEASVTDTGSGIAPEHLPRVFDRFYRAETARTRGASGGGTGLGLSIARDLARHMGGDLAAENVEGGGAGFRLVLPKG